ncbi:MAG: hypothetical protein AAF696_28965 [Bacteroidota bacterium]
MDTLSLIFLILGPIDFILILGIYIVWKWKMRQCFSQRTSNLPTNFSENNTHRGEAFAYWEKSQKQNNSYDFSSKSH